MLSSAEWAAFRAQEAVWVAAGRPPSDLHTRSGKSGSGEVVFAKRGVIIDGDYEDLIPGGLTDLRSVEFVQGNPSCLEFHTVTIRRNSVIGTPGWMRVPVASGETREAMKRLQHSARPRSPPSP